MEQAGVAEEFEESLDELRQFAEQAELLLQKKPQQELVPIACRAGCGSCCVLNVSVLLSEGIAIKRHLQQLKKAEVALISERLENLWQAVRGLDDEERLVVQRKCAFLNEQGSCQIYPVRPLLCRSITSSDAQSCRDALTGAVYGEESSVLMYQYQQDLFESLFTDLADKLERRGIDGRSFQLSGLLRFLLKYPDAEKKLARGHRLAWQEFY